MAASLTQKAATPFNSSSDENPLQDTGLLMARPSVVQQIALQSGLNFIDSGLSGIFNAQVMQAQAADFGFAARQEELKGQQEAVATLAQLNELQAGNMVAAYASGIQASGSVAVAQTVVGRRAGLSMALSTTNARIRSEALQREQKRLKAEADYFKTIAPFKIAAGAGLIGFGI